MKAPAFQLYAGDFLSSPDVQIMTAEEAGAYCLLLFSSWQFDFSGYLPDDEKLLHRLTRLPTKKWKASRELLLRKFPIAAQRGGSDMSTALTCADIQLTLFAYYLRSDIVICLSTEALGNEADLVVVQPTGLIAEIKIKISRSDFKADFKKELKYLALSTGRRLYWRTADAPTTFTSPCQPMVAPEEVPAYCGLIYIHSRTKYGSKYERAEIVRKAPRLHTQKCSEKTMRRIARSLMYKVFNAGSHELPEHANLAWQPEDGEVPRG